MKAVSQRCLVSTPAYLYIQLQRFANHQSLKVETKVIPENLLVLPNSDEYKLISIANHLGTQIRCGHYQALIKIGTKWTMCDDDKSFKTNLNKELNVNNYILVYEKISCIKVSENSNNVKKMFKDQADNSKEHAPQLKIEEARLMEEEKKGSLDTSKNIEEVPNDEIFLFVKGKVKFEEVEYGKIKCGGCGETFSRIVGHLTKNHYCAENIDIAEFKSSWSKFTAKRSMVKFRNKKLENKEQFLKEEAS